MSEKEEYKLDIFALFEEMETSRLEELEKFVSLCLHWWNIQRGYRADGSEEIDEFSDEVVEDYEVELRLKICDWLRKDWLARGNKLHPPKAEKDD